MKRFALVTALIALVAITPASAETQDKHALGDMYTRALNAIESQGQLDTLEPRQNVRITDMHIDHGQVFVTIVKESQPTTVVFDMMSGRIVPQSENAE